MQETERKFQERIIKDIGNEMIRKDQTLLEMVVESILNKILKWKWELRQS